MFYDTFIKLCKEKNVKPTPLVVKMGLSSSNVTQWKKGSTPRPEVLQRIADEFGVSVKFLLTEENEKEPAGQETDGRAERFMELFSSLTEEKQDLVINLLEGLRDSGAAHLAGKEGTGETNQAP